MYQYYQQIFNHKYLSTQIFKHVHQIQCNHYSLKYDEIVDIGWMHKYNHKGLLKEKLNNSNNSNNNLYIKPKYLFTAIANNDTELFISLFERYKYLTLDYYLFHSDEILSILNNIEVVKYLFQRGYARQVYEIKIDKVDRDIIFFYIDNKWLKPTISIFSQYIRELEQENQTARTDLQDSIQLIVKHLENPNLNHLDFFKLVRYPIPSLIQQLLPLLQQKYHQESLEIESSQLKILIDNIQSQEDELVRTKESNSVAVVAAKADLFKLMKEGLLVDPLISVWCEWVVKGDEEFFGLWNRLSKRLRVSSNHIYFNTTTDIDASTSDCQLRRDSSVLDIGRIVIDSCCVNTSVQVLKFLYQQGYNLVNRVRNNTAFFKTLVLLTGNQDRETIVELANSTQNIILPKIRILECCCRAKHRENLDYYLGKFKADINDQQIKRLFKLCNKKPYLIKLLTSHGLQWPSASVGDLVLYNYCWFEKFSAERLEKAFKSIVFTTKNQAEWERREMFLNSLLVHSINNNDYPSFKHLIINARMTLDVKDQDIQISLALCTNLNIIDYVNKNRSTCFSISLSALVVNKFFADIFEKSFDQESFNPLLIDYMIKQNAINTKTLSTLQTNLLESRTQLDKVQFTPKQEITFNYFVYFVQEYKHDSIDLLCSVLIQSSQFVEYIYRNQNRFTSTPRFQSIYDYIIQNFLGSSSFGYYLHLIKDLINRYDCIDTSGIARFDI
ncbi:hypothetical protein CYY_008024 [Polysphondylium violaceum]|uniref:Uncharacterized protein n=1 Tax=Polysphondylium violaceum TaxID=133409 RepID=A0A8J4PW73_9MYCE|nr:hypothetical protein CYY_008024 [Polysphondylium violaceum]